MRYDFENQPVRSRIPVVKIVTLSFIKKKNVFKIITTLYRIKLMLYTLFYKNAMLNS